MTKNSKLILCEAVAAALLAFIGCMVVSSRVRAEDSKPQEIQTVQSEPVPPQYQEDVPLLEGADGLTAYGWELDELARIVWLEAQGESEECQRCICEVVLNRVHSGIWGSTVHEVLSAIEDNGAPAFSTYGMIEGAAVPRNVIDLVTDVFMNGSDLPCRVMWFRADHYHTWTGAVAEFAVDHTYFSSSAWVQAD